jgi:hypothetical protein
MATVNLVDISAAARDLLMPEVYRLQEKYDQTAIYRTLKYLEAPAGAESVTVPVMSRPATPGKYVLNSGTTITPTARTASVEKMLLDQVAVLLHAIGTYEQLETSVQFREQVAQDILVSLRNDMSDYALAMLGTISAANEEAGILTPKTDASAPIAYTDWAAMTTEIERLIGLMIADLRNVDVPESTRYILMPADLETMVQKHGTGQNTYRPELAPAWIRGSLNPILGAIPYSVPISKLGAEHGIEGYETVTEVPIVVYDPECALFGVQADPTIELFNESAILGLQVRGSDKYGAKAFDTRRLRCGYIRIAGNPYDL